MITLQLRTLISLCLRERSNKNWYKKRGAFDRESYMPATYCKKDKLNTIGRFSPLHTCTECRIYIRTIWQLRTSAEASASRERRTYSYETHFINQTGHWITRTTENFLRQSYSPGLSVFNLLEGTQTNFIKVLSCRTNSLLRRKFNSKVFRIQEKVGEENGDSSPYVKRLTRYRVNRTLIVEHRIFYPIQPLFRSR